MCDNITRTSLNCHGIIGCLNNFKNRKILKTMYQELFNYSTFSLYNDTGFHEVEADIYFC